MRDNERRTNIILAVCGIVPVVWISLLIAPAVKGGLPEIVSSAVTLFNNPFHIELCEDSVKTVLILLFCYGMGIGIWLSTRRNYRRREEHGSAKWGEARAVNKKYHQSPASNNKLMTQNVSIGLNAKKHRRNLNTLVCGGSGAGKTRFYCKPNLMQANTSFVILDPKGEILRDTGGLLEKKGYEVRVLDLISMELSHCYNPFVYLKSDNDIQRLVTNLFKSTTPKGSQSNDPFWDTSASMLLSALIYYLHYEAPEEEQNFPMVWLLKQAERLDKRFDEVANALSDINAFNAGKKRDSALKTLAKWIPDAEKFTVQIKSVNQYIRKLENAYKTESSLNSDYRSKVYTDEEALKEANFEIYDLRRKLEQTKKTLDRVPPEILEQYRKNPKPKEWER